MAQRSKGSSSKLHINFSKLHGAQNDFIAIDNRYNEVQMTVEQRRLMCDRHRGVGADGIMEIHASDVADFKISHFNADGAQSSLCGNGLRCGLIFCRKIGIPRRTVKDLGDQLDDKVSKNGANSSPEHCDNNDIEMDIRRYGFPKSYYLFEAFDGIHEGALSDTDDECFIRFRPVDVAKVTRYENGDFFLDTGSPHHVRFVPSVDVIDAEAEGRPIRYGKYGVEGSNVNFASEKRTLEIPELILQAKTYERCNELETKACGTGAVAIAIADVIGRRFRSDFPLGVEPVDKHDRNGTLTLQQDAGKTKGEGDGDGENERWFSRYIEMPGGMLRVYFRLEGGRVDSIWLQGPALCVMDGCYPLC